MNTRSAERQRLAAEIREAAEQVVIAAEQALAAARDPTEADIAATRLTEIYAESDAALAEVGPTLAAREQDLRRQANDVCRAMAGEPLSDWTLKHRRYFSTALKARLVRKIGRRLYERIPL
jgi:hypothetical protein